MVAVLSEQPHFQLPARIREAELPADSNPARLILADRIAGLPGILTVENGPDTLPCSVTVYLQQEHGPVRKRTAPMTLCVISRDGLTVHGLAIRDRQQILARGWGILHHDRVQVFLPRDEQEVDVCWMILQYAHCSLLNISARSSASRTAFHRQLPRFSRTTLQ